MRAMDFGLYFENLPKVKRVAFNRQTRHVCALYEHCFPGIHVKGVWKIQATCVIQYHKRWRTEVVNVGGVLEAQIRVRLDTFFGADRDKRKRVALQWLHRGALKIAKFHGWPEEPFEAARKGVIRHGYVNEWVWRKSSPDRRHKAELFCSFEADRFRAWLRIRAKSGEVLSEKLAINELPSEFCFVPKMGDLKWRSNQQVALLDKNGKRVEEVSVPKVK